METKACCRCGKAFERDHRITQKVWDKRRFCSIQCYASGKRKPSESKVCETCGKEFFNDRERGRVAWQRRRFCSTACAYVDRKGKKRGADHHAWRGGRTVDPSGYVRVAMRDDHPFVSMRLAHGYILEHRLVMAEHLGRPLRADETVHHRNGRRDDNRLKNLELRMGRHGKGAAMCCAECGSTNLVPVEV